MSRTRDDDACPGALQVHQAADGALARVRLPGGMITAGQLEALAHAATEYGNGTLELTVRGNVQLRGVRDTAAVADAATGAGLLPSPDHERVRNIIASPLSGRVGGLADVRPWVAELDRGIQSDPELVRLPGRFMFGLDDGTGDISGLRADAGAHVLGERAALLLAGRDTGVRLGFDEVVPALLAVARRFVAVRGQAWRVSELDDPSVLVSELRGDGARRDDPSTDAAAAGRLDPAGRRAGGSGGRGAAGCVGGQTGALRGRDRRAGGDHPVAVAAGV